MWPQEYYEQSIWLLYVMLGWEGPSKRPHINVRRDAVYEEKITLRTTSRIDAILAESCLPDIYAAARERFENVYRLARAYCKEREPCDLATSELGRRLWTPLTGMGTSTKIKRARDPQKTRGPPHLCQKQRL